jgi:hypothetical protein
VVAKRLKQELVQALDQVEVPAAAVVEPEAAAPAMDVPRELGADERQAMQVAAVQKAAANGKVRPPVTPIPEVPAVTTNLEKAVKDLEAGEITDDVVKLLDDEARLQEHYKRVEAAAEAAQTQEIRDAIGYDELSYEQKKALGVTDGFEKPAGSLTSQNAGTLDERAAFARQQLEQAQAQGDEAGANAWRQELRQLERSRLANAMDANTASQQGLFGAGQYDDTAPLLNQPGALASAQDFNGGGLPGGYQELPSYYEMNGYERARYNNMREIGDSLTEEIRRVAGQDIQVNIDPRRYLVKGKVPGWAEGKPGSTKQIGGWYSPMEDMITINNVLAGEDGRLLQTAYHEAFHRMQYAILTKQELDVMNALPARMKTVAGSFMDVPKGTNLLEYQAVAFQKYAYARQLGIDPAFYMFGGTKTGAPRMQKYLAQVMAVFDKVWNVLERVHNWANGRGYQSIKDIYENAFLGKLGQREPDFALEYITPDQVARTRVLEGWKKTLYSVDERVTQLDAEMNQIRALAAKEGC